MVEHRTENSGVRGSNPFIGSVKKLFYRKNLWRLRKLLLISYPQTQRLLSTNLVVTPFVFNTWNLDPLTCLIVTHIPITYSLPAQQSNAAEIAFFFKNYRALPANKRATLKVKSTNYSELLQNFLYVYPLLNKKRQKTPAHIHYNMLNSLWWYKFYLQAVTQQFLQFKTTWFLVECSHLVTTGFYGNIFVSVYKKNVLRNFFCNREKFIHWFTKLTVFKDLSIFVKMVLRWLMASQLRKHRRIFVLINQFLKMWYGALYEYSKIRGYCIFFKGKLGRKGSVRKTKYFSKKGEVSYSTKSLRLSYRTFHFSTITGVVGGGISLFY